MVILCCVDAEVGFADDADAAACAVAWLGLHRDVDIRPSAVSSRISRSLEKFAKSAVDQRGHFRLVDAHRLTRRCRPASGGGA